MQPLVAKNSKFAVGFDQPILKFRGTFTWVKFLRKASSLLFLAYTIGVIAEKIAEKIASGVNSWKNFKQEL